MTTNNTWSIFFIYLKRSGKERYYGQNAFSYIITQYRHQRTRHKAQKYKISHVTLKIKTLQPQSIKLFQRRSTSKSPLKKIHKFYSVNSGNSTKLKVHKLTLTYTHCLPVLLFSQTTLSTGEAVHFLRPGPPREELAELKGPSDNNKGWRNLNALNASFFSFFSAWRFPKLQVQSLVLV